jgi:probable HAF family extracellular repeat protein
MCAIWRRLALGSMGLLPFLYTAGAAAQPSYHLQIIAPSFIPVAISDRNQVVGLAQDRPDSGQIGLWTPGASQTVTWMGNPLDEPADINGAGQIAATRSLGNSLYQAAILSNGTYRDLGSIGGDTSLARAINANGQVTGLATNASGDTRAFLYSGGVMTELGTLGGSGSGGLDINGRGQVVGFSSVRPGDPNSEHAFLYSDGRMIDLGSFGGNSSFAMTINDAGQIAGYVNKADGAMHGFLYEDGATTWIGPDLMNVTPFAINNRGDVVGSARSQDGTAFAFLFSDGKLSSLGTLLDNEEGWDVYGASDINDQGSIIGYGCRRSSDFDCAAVFLSPVPEPATWMLYAGGIFIGLAWRRSSRRT